MRQNMAMHRRFGDKNAANRALLVEATEQLLREEGYAAISARNVAKKAGLTPQLLYYYFRTMDDLVLAVHEKITRRRLLRFTHAVSSPEPLRALWELNSGPAGAIIATELAAIAHHRPAIRAEIVRSAREFRFLQIEAVSSILEKHGVDQRVYPAAGVVTIAAALARTFVIDEALGISDGYDQAIVLVERALQSFRAGRARVKGRVRRSARATRPSRKAAS
jgi:TetR/AcrR family transcriptional regulator